MPAETFTERYPESLGPGVESGDGAVRYGDTQQPRVVIGTPMSPEERAAQREREQAALAALDVQCPRCAGIPGDVLSLLRAALQQKPGARR
jgi:hypothetical protein